MTKAHINSGVCGFQTDVDAQADDNYNVQLTITSDCKRIQRLAAELTSAAALEEISKPIHETRIYIAAGQCRLHSACPVPCGIIKAVEQSAGLALAADAQITIVPD